jgi:hypothetical protein
MISALRSLVRIALLCEGVFDGEGTFESDRLAHSYKIVGGGTRMFVESVPKDPNWLEKIDIEMGKISVDTTIDLDTNGEDVYLNRIDAWIGGKGYGRETLHAIAMFLRNKGFKRVKGYIERDNQSSQNMARKLGLKPTDAKQHGDYWTINLEEI